VRDLVRQAERELKGLNAAAIGLQMEVLEIRGQISRERAK
jgi:hypothetical protein